MEENLENIILVPYMDISQWPNDLHLQFNQTQDEQMDAEYDAENPAPEAVAKAREAVLAADGVWFFTPEYNFSYPGLLKNLLDWLSRPRDPSDRTSPSVLAGKKCAVSGVGGRNATADCRGKLADRLAFVGMKQLRDREVGLALPPSSWTTDDLALDEAGRAALAAQASAFADFLES